ncbi:hypothetical protein PENSPDRAFT_680353 [Peniophora sp. CONT]|nr:hypothetical protein PENSPDRAFT_680353 [Peniophora sp. CONT]
MRVLPDDVFDRGPGLLPDLISILIFDISADGPTTDAFTDDLLSGAALQDSLAARYDDLISDSEPPTPRALARTAIPPATRQGPAPPTHPNNDADPTAVTFPPPQLPRLHLRHPLCLQRPAGRTAHLPTAPTPTRTVKGVGSPVASGLSGAGGLPQDFDPFNGGAPIDGDELAAAAGSGSSTNTPTNGDDLTEGLATVEGVLDTVSGYMSSFGRRALSTLKALQQVAGPQTRNSVLRPSVSPLHHAYLRVAPAIGEARARKLRTKKSYTRIVAVGYCHSDSIGVELGKSPELVHSLVIADSGSIKMDDVKLMNFMSYLEGVEDFSFKPHLRNGAEAIFREREGKENFVPYEFKDWKGCAHGSAIRPNQTVPEVKAGY